LGGGKIKVGKYIMETTGFSETSVNIYQMTNQRIPEAEYPNIPLGEYLRT
jgi:hypothetical protein